jgi:hypothetical protein
LENGKIGKWVIILPFNYFPILLRFEEFTNSRQDFIYR